MADITGCGTFFSREIAIFITGRTGAEKDVVAGAALVQVDGMGPGVRNQSLKSMAEAFVDLNR